MATHHGRYAVTARLAQGASRRAIMKKRFAPYLYTIISAIVTLNSIAALA